MLPTEYPEVDTTRTFLSPALSDPDVSADVDTASPITSACLLWSLLLCWPYNADGSSCTPMGSMAPSGAGVVVARVLPASMSAPSTIRAIRGGSACVPNRAGVFVPSSFLREVWAGANRLRCRPYAGTFPLLLLLLLLLCVKSDVPNRGAEFFPLVRWSGANKQHERAAQDKILSLIFISAPNRRPPARFLSADCGTRDFGWPRFPPLRNLKRGRRSLPNPTFLTCPCSTSSAAPAPKYNGRRGADGGWRSGR